MKFLKSIKKYFLDRLLLWKLATKKKVENTAIKEVEESEKELNLIREELNKKADFIILNSNPLENISNLQDVCMVVKDGRIVRNDSE